MCVYPINLPNDITYVPLLRFSWEAIGEDVSSREGHRLNDERLIVMICEHAFGFFFLEMTRRAIRRPACLNVAKNAERYRRLRGNKYKSSIAAKIHLMFFSQPIQSAAICVSGNGFACGR
jgi:hypothetical protein